MSKKTWAVLFGILALATFFRFFHITTTPPGLYPDEAMNGSNGLHAWHTGEFSWFYPENNGREALFINLQSLAVHFTGIREAWVLRSVAGVFGVLTVLAVFLLAKEFFNPTTGLLAAFFIATNFWHINFSRIGFRAIMAPFFATLGLYFLIKAFREQKNRWWGWMVMAGITLGFGFHSYIAYRVIPAVAVVIGFYFLLSAKKKLPIIAKSIVCGICALIVFAPLGYYFLKNPGTFFGRTSQVSVFSSPSPAHDLALNIAKTIGMFFVNGDGNWRHNYSGAPELFAPVALFFAIGIVCALVVSARLLVKTLYPTRWPTIRGTDISYIALLSWLVFASLPVVISNEGIPHALRSILLIPPVIILAATGAVWLFEFLKKKISLPYLQILTLVTLITIGSFGYYQYFVLWANNPNVSGAFAENYVKLGHTINALPKELPKYIIVRAGGTLVNGIPMPTQTVMFLTDSYDRAQQEEKNIHYIFPEQENQIPVGAFTAVIE